MEYFRWLLGFCLTTSIWSANTNAASISTDCPANISEPIIHIKFGMSTALSGPLQRQGLLLSQGVQQKITEANCDSYWRKKGIQFELIIQDDSYDPGSAATNTRELIDKHKVIAIVGSLGTPTANASWKIANNKKVVFYGAYTGSHILRLTPPAPYVFNYRPSYDQEMEYIVGNIITQGIPATSIGLFLQDDAFGHSGLTSLGKALEKRCGDCRENILQMRYERNSLKTNSALKKFINTDVKPKAIILVGTLGPAIEFMRFAQRLSPGTHFYSLSFINMSELREKLNHPFLNLTVSQVIPVLNTTTGSKNTIPMNEVYQEAYLETKLLLDAMKTINGPITSETVRISLIKIDQQLPGIIGDQQMMNDIWLTQLHNKTGRGTGAHAE